MNLIYKINSEIELWTDEYSFVVRFKKNEKYQNNKNWYFPNLGVAFEEIFDYLVKKKAKDSPEANELRNLKGMIWEIKKELWNAVRDLKPSLSVSKREGEVFMEKR